MVSEPLPCVGSAPSPSCTESMTALCKGSAAWWETEMDQWMLAVRMGTGEAPLCSPWRGDRRYRGT